MNISLAHLKKMQQSEEKIACLTAYDASFAYWANEAHVEVILVGDSLSMVVQGHENTLPASMDDMVYHARAVRRGIERSRAENNQAWSAWCVVDMPFMSDATIETALVSASRLMKEGLANMVKLEGGDRVLGTVSKLAELGVPVCGHLGLLPQTVQKNGYQSAGKTPHSAEKLVQDAINLEKAGAEMLVLECVPSALAQKITESIDIPVIGIGSGGYTDGQVLVVYDVLGLTPGRVPSFSRNFLQDTQSIPEALCAYVSAVKSNSFPG